MKLTTRQLRHLIREELVRSVLSEASKEDQMAFQKIMSLITNTLGEDDKATQEIEDMLLNALQDKSHNQPAAGGQISMKSLAH